MIHVKKLNPSSPINTVYVYYKRGEWLVTTNIKFPVLSYKTLKGAKRAATNIYDPTNKYKWR